MNTVRTPSQILQRVEAIADDDWLGTQRNDLINALPFDEAKKFLKPEVTAEQWEARKCKPPMQKVSEYLPFAWDKANGNRGISAGRSLDHMKAWLWLAGHDELLKQHFEHYEHYGKFQLVIASELVGFDWRAHDDGRWVNDESDEHGLGAEAVKRLADKAAEIAKRYALPA